MHKLTNDMLRRSAVCTFIGRVDLSPSVCFRMLPEDSTTQGHQSLKARYGDTSIETLRPKSTAG